MPQLAPWSAILVAIPATAIAGEDRGAGQSVGVATMLANGTILVGVGEDGPGARAQFVLELHPGDTNYQMMIDHLGGLKPGETKPIPPWPDQPAVPAADPPPPKENAPTPAPPNRG
jgi:hypothetical protein